MEASLFSFSSISYLVSSLLFILGLKYLGSPMKARKGNVLSGIGMVIAVLVTLLVAYWNQSVSLGLMVTLAAILIGTLIGFSLAEKVMMTNMPQLVSLFNATGGGCAMLLGIMELNQYQGTSYLHQMMLATSTSVGGATFSGSLVAYIKLNSSTRINHFDANVISHISKLLLVGILAIIPSMVFMPGEIGMGSWLLVVSLVALMYGVAFVLPIGGSDMPVVISLLNALTGIATGIAGISLDNKVMILGGVLVGAAGVILTMVMCKSMNRSLLNVVSGVVKGAGPAEGNAVLDVKATSVSQVSMKLAFASKVGIIPGFGLAVAQAQHACASLQFELEKRGAEVKYMIHPVAGRMPGHMNVLLAEAEIRYTDMLELAETNARMAEFDVVLVVGANDVVNPSAIEDPDSPLFGMPIIEAHRAKQVVMMKRGMSMGYAGVPNSLFEKPNCELLFGDADTTLKSIGSELKSV